MRTVEQEFWDKHWARAWAESAHFWRRIPAKDFTGLRVLDFGCGLGGLPVQLMERGAMEVVGLEMDPDYCDYANRRIAQDYPAFSDRIVIAATPLNEVPAESFDVIVSKDVLEHVLGLEDVFPVLVSKLKPGGEMLLGFGPLWHGPFGDHGISQTISRGVKVPWLHLLVGKRLLLDRLNQKRARDGGRPYESLEDAGFNQLPIEEMERIIGGSGLEVCSYELNVTSNPIARLVDALPVPKPLRRYFARTVYCRLRKSALTGAPAS